MDSQQTKEYLKCVFELEGALYKHQKLVDGYTDRRNKNVPQEPPKYLPTPPTKPIPKIASTSTPMNKMSPQSAGVAVLLTITGCISFFLIFWSLGMMASGYDTSSLLIWGIIISPVPIYCFYYLRKEKKAQESKVESENKLEYQKYEREMEAHRILVANAETEHSNKMQKYWVQRADYNKETAEQLQKFNEVKTTLQNSLTKLYSQNVIYAKYRNLVAVATIYEYFDSGRCTELEGPNGAYNMYEGELRSNIIICSLSQIIADLTQIKNGQYALYEQISRSNENVTYLLNNIYNAQMLTAYYAEAAAIAASADRITYGVIY